MSDSVIDYIIQDTIIYQAGNKAESIALILQGEVQQENSFTSETIYPGSFIGIQGIMDGVHNYTYTARSDLTVRTFEVDNMKSFIEFLIENSDLHEDLVVELSYCILQLSDLYNLLYNQTNNFYQTLVMVNKHYLQNCATLKAEPVDIPIGKEFFDLSLDSHDFYADLENFQKIKDNPNIAYEQIRETDKKILTTQLNTLLNIYKSYLKLKSYILKLSTVFINKDDVSLFKAVSDLAVYAREMNEDNSFVLRLLDTMRSSLQTSIDKFETISNLNLNIDIDYVDLYLNKASDIPRYNGTDPLNQPVNTFVNLMNYAEFDEEKQEEFKEAINRFMALSDKFSREDADKKIFLKITQLYYELYETIFFKSIQDTSEYKMVDLFLNFGFLDERLLESKQVDFIINNYEELEDTSPCPVYRMKDWLISIYEGKNTPSKNEFDEDYFDTIRHRKRQENFTKAKELELLNDPVLRTQFEIKNMFRYNNRLINGHLYSFVPMLFEDIFEFNNIVLNGKIVNDNIMSIVDIDYSIFYRELLYENEEAKIKKELIQKEIYPDIILFPVYGMNAIMWQETTRNQSDSRGRFFLPSMTNANLEDMFLALIGKFRWELCKQQQSYAWNDIRIPSLTSEYNDYIQFYRKNNELSAEKKEFVKNQISKCRNNIREIFTFDYMVWIKYESKGAVRLNTVARMILSTYCPFSKDIREKLTNQPMFNKAMFKYKRNKTKKSREIHNRITSLTNKGATITKELLDTQKFYAEL